MRGAGTWGQTHGLQPPHPCLLQPHPDVKPMAYASTLLQLGMM